MFWLGYRDSDSRGKKPLGRRGSDSLVKGCHSLPLRSNPNFMRENKNNTQQGAVLFWLGYRDSDSRGKKPLGRRGSDSLVKGCHSLPLRSNPNFMRENKNNTQQGAVLFWLGYRDSNPNIQSQSLLCYRYTISHRMRMIVYQDRKDLSRFFRKFVDKIFYER